MLRRRAAALVLAVAAPLVCASVAGAAGSGGSFRELHTRGGVIGCQYAAGGSLPRPLIRCDIRGGLKPRPPRPKRCAPGTEIELDWAVGILLQSTGRAQVLCASDSTLGARGRLLRTGALWQAGGISCHALAAQTLACENATGHGFVLSPRRWSVY